MQENAVQRYTINLDNLPPSDDEDACAAYEAPLCRDFNNNSKSSRSTSGRAGVIPLNLTASGASGVLESDAMTIEVHETDEDEIGHELAEGETGDASELVSAPLLTASELWDSLWCRESLVRILYRL